MAYSRPGVYVEEITNLPPSVAGVATAIPAFIGYTETATLKTSDDLILKPTRITSMKEFEKYFGLAKPETEIVVSITTSAVDGRKSAIATLAETDRCKFLMWYALRLYFDNGGGPCYICSVADYDGTKPKLIELLNGLAPVGKEDEPTLLVFPDAQNLDSAGDFKSLYTQALQQCADMKSRFVIMDTHGSGGLSLNEADTNIQTVVQNFRNDGIPSDNLEFAAAYAPNIESTIRFAFIPEQTKVTNTAAPAPTPAPAPAPAPAPTPAASTITLDKLNDPGSPNHNTGDYNLALAAIDALTCKLPPAGAIAGIYARVDNDRGVWKAPANTSVFDAIQPTIAIDNTTQDILNVDPTTGKSVNAIRAFTGIGTLVWGARTLAGNDNEWRYINVRRFCLFAEESIRRATRQFVFEPNDANTWIRVKGMIENFLTTQWRQGALMGAKTADAFSVQVGLGTTMSADDVLEGRMIVVVGLCPVRPAEFIVLRFVQTMPKS